MKHIVIVGGGFAGLTIAKQLRRHPFKVTLVDKNNYHQFAPLFYQVAAAQIEPSSILFPLRKEVKQYPKQEYIMATAQTVDTKNSILKTNVCDFQYDYLILALGADTNYFGMENVMKNSFPMKSVSEALTLRNHILEVLEKAAGCKDQQNNKITIAVIGGGATGVEVAGALGEMKRYVLPKDYPELPTDNLRILLIEGSTKVLAAMSEKSSENAATHLHELGVELLFGNHVTDYDGEIISFNNGETIKTNTVIWVSGIAACSITGLNDKSLLGRGGRLFVNEYNQVKGFDNIYAIGDMCLQTEKKYPNAHPQVAQVAIQQAQNLAKNICSLNKRIPLKPFNYVDKGTMAIVGKNRAVADLAKLHFKGFSAWFVWLFIHLFSILGFKNKITVVLNWAFTYFFNDSSLRLIIRSKEKESTK